SSMPPQPSLAGPQSAPRSLHVFGVHPVPHVCGLPPPPHVWPAGQLPQSSVPPQPSPIIPQVAPAIAQVTCPLPASRPSSCTGPVQELCWPRPRPAPESLDVFCPVALHDAAATKKKRRRIEAERRRISSS